MKKTGIAIFSLFVLISSSFCVEVDENELKVPGSDSIQFENYGGPHAVIETANAITNIGREFGSPIAASLETFATVSPYGKYSLVHAVNPEEKTKLDADILFVNENAMVDHIKNLRRIVSGFLQAAYGYSKEDSETLSVFVTIYNAVYRNNIENFETKYKDSVLRYITERSVGLSTNWEDWAGNTQIVIPLNDFSGLSSVDTTAISDEKVIEALQQQEDKGIEVREQLTDLKEREAQTATSTAQEAQKTAAQERKEGNTAKAEQAQKTATTQQQTADRKTSEVRAERKEIANDKAEVAAKKEEQKEEPKYLTSLFGADDKTKLYTFITLDEKSGSVVRKSPVKLVREKSYFTVSGITVQNDEGNLVSYPEMLLAICGENSKRSAVKLCLLDTTLLEVQKQSSETLSETSPLVNYKDEFFVIIQEGKKFYPASFDKNLLLKKKGTIPVKQTSPIVPSEKGVFVTDEKGNPRLLKLSDLTDFYASYTSTADAK